MDTSKLHERIAAVAPIDGVCIGNATDKSTWVICFQESATARQQAAAKSIIDNWSEADWEGTLAERQRNRLEEVIALQTRITALNTEKNYWTSQLNVDKTTMIQTLIDQAQALIDALRPQT